MENKKTERIPLEERLLKAGSGMPCFLAAFKLYVDDYFRGLEEITGNSYFTDVYKEKIRKYIRKCTEEWEEWEEAGEYPEDGQQPLTEPIFILSELVYTADILPPWDYFDLLYRILVEPFALMDDQMEKKKGEEACV